MNSRAQSIFRVVKLFYMILCYVSVIKYLPKPTECTTPTMNPNVNNGLRVMMMYQYMLTQMYCPGAGCDSKAGYANVRTGVWELPISSAQFCCEPNTAL